MSKHTEINKLRLDCIIKTLKCILVLRIEDHRKRKKTFRRYYALKEECFQLFAELFTPTIIFNFTIHLHFTK